MDKKAIGELLYGGTTKVVRAFFSAEFFVTLRAIAARLLLTYLACVAFMQWSSNLEVRDIKNPCLYRVKPAWRWQWHTEERAA